MIKTILKFVLPVHEPMIQMPPGANVIHVGFQRDAEGINRLTLWAECEVPDVGWKLGDWAEVRDFKVVGTGRDMPNTQHWRHIGTAVGDPFVWHVYEKPQPRMVPLLG